MVVNIAKTIRNAIKSALQSALQGVMNSVLKPILDGAFKPILGFFKKIGQIFVVLGKNIEELFQLFGCGFEKIGGLFTTPCILVYIIFIGMNLTYWIISLVLTTLIGKQMWNELAGIGRELQDILWDLMKTMGMDTTINDMKRGCYCKPPKWTPFPKL